MGQSWWWVVLVVLVVVVVAALAVLLIRWRVQRGVDAGAPPPSDVEIAAAAAGGAVGAVGAAGVAGSRAEAAPDPERSLADTVAADAVPAAVTRPGPHPGSVLPAADGSAPSSDHPVKANDGSRRYHPPDSPYYVRTRADLWFRTEQEARSAGFAAWDEGR